MEVDKVFLVIPISDSTSLGLHQTAFGNSANILPFERETQQPQCLPAPSLYFFGMLGKGSVITTLRPGKTGTMRRSPLIHQGCDTTSNQEKYVSV